MIPAFCFGATMAVVWVHIEGTALGAMVVYFLAGNIFIASVLAPHIEVVLLFRTGLRLG